MGVVVWVDVEADGALIVTNPDPAEMSDRPIQPKLQPIAGPSSSNTDILVNDIRDDTDVLRIVEPLEKMDKKNTYRQTNPGELLYTGISCENDNEHDGRSMNVAGS